MEKITNVIAMDVTLACDNLRAVELAATYKYINVRQQHFDMARAIIAVKEKIHSKINFKHVKGHMNEKKQFNELSRLEQLNVLCDSYAKEANDSLRPMEARHLQGEGLSLWYKDRKIYSSFKENIKHRNKHQI